ncbi:MAG: alpha/beta hydrolase [Rudaea sp.]
MVANAASIKVSMTKSSAMTLRSVEGLHLAVQTWGDPTAPALVFAHGFGQTRHAWGTSAATLAARGWYCLSADARGHGESGWREDGNYDFAQFVDDLRLVARQPVQRPILIGASMGGLLGIMAQAGPGALDPGPFRALVLVDITPRWETQGVDRILAFMRAYPQGFETLEQAAAAIALHLPHRKEQKSPQRLRSLLMPSHDGRLRWHWDPRLLERIATDGQSQQAALLDAARRICVPTLLISAEHSDIVSDATIAEFQHCVPHASHVRVRDATHMIVGDRNDAFTAAVENFIQPLRESAGGTSRSNST